MSFVLFLLAATGAVWPVQIWSRNIPGWHYHVESWYGYFQIWRISDPPPGTTPDGSVNEFLIVKVFQYVNGDWTIEVLLWPLAVIFAILPLVWLIKNFRLSKPKTLAEKSN